MWRVGVPTLIVAAAVTIAACSGDDETAGSSTIAATSTVAVTTATTSDPERTDSAAASTVPTTDASTTTTEAAPATEAPTTTSPQSRAIEELAGFQQTGDRTGLPLFAPLSPAYVYYEGLVLLAEHGDPFPDSRTTATDGGFRISGGGSTVTLDNFVSDDTGLIVDFNRNGTPVSTTVVGLGYAVEAGQLTGLVHSARLFDGVLQVVMQSTNNSTEDSSFYVDSYVQADGRQLEASPTTSLSNTIRPGATVAYLYVVEDAAFGGTLFGQLGGGTDFVYADVEVAVPTPG